jgi:hypothetical protein
MTSGDNRFHMAASTVLLHEFVAVCVQGGVASRSHVLCMASKSLRSLSGIEGVSDTALSRIIGRIKQTPTILFEASSRSTIHRHALAAARDVGFVEHTIALTKGPPLVWQVLAMQDILPYLCKVCPHFCQLLGELYAECGAEWHVILYCDGVTPGAVLAPENHRKSVIWYATLLEFGSRLCHQELWFCLASIQASVSKLVPARLAGLTRLIVRDMVCGDRAIDTAGILLPVGRDGRHELVRIHYHATLADEEALSSMLGLKGSSGVAPCAMRCWCVMKEKKADADRGLLPITARGDNIADITSTKKADIVLKSDADVWDDCDYLVRNVGQAGFAEIESCVGINCHLEGILFDRELRKSFKPSSSHRYDALHVLLSNGLLAAELMYFMKDAKSHVGVYFSAFRDYAERVRWQCGGTVKPQDVFSAAREKSSDTTLKAGASELLASYAVFRQWALEMFVGIPAMRSSLRSLLILLDVVDLVLAAATQPLRGQEDVESIASRLDAAAFAYLEAFANAHGRSEMKHKHHELVHLAEQVRKDKRLLWCFTAERKHIVAKALMSQSKKMQAFALGAVSRMLMAQITSLDDNPGWVSRLKAPECDFDDLAHGCRMSKGMRWLGCVVSHGDPLFVGRGHAVLLLVVACVTVDGSFGVLAHQCRQILGCVYSSEWAVQPAIVHRKLVPTDVIRVARHWRFTDASRLTVLY